MPLQLRIQPRQHVLLFGSFNTPIFLFLPISNVLLDFELAKDEPQSQTVQTCALQYFEKSSNHPSAFLHLTNIAPLVHHAFSLNPLPMC